MGKEAKLGVALIALLLGVFGFMLYKRVKAAQESAATAAAADTASDQAPSAEAPAEKLKLSSGPRKPVAVQQPAPEAAVTSEPPDVTSRHDRYGSRYSDAGAAKAQTGSGENRYGDRSTDRYGSTAQQIYGPSAQTTEPAAESSTESNDPFSRYNNTSTGSRLRPTSDAAAALLPASATSETPPATTTQEQQEQPESTAENTAATETAEPEAANPLRPVPSSEGRAAGPRSFDIYGTSQPTEDRSATQVAAPVEPATNRRSPPPADRYSSGTSTNGGTNNWTPTTPTSPPVTQPEPHPTTPVVEHRAPRTQPVAPVTRTETYVVEANENLSLISQKLYGTDHYFKALQEHNKARYPRAELIKAGDVLQTPSVEVLMQKYPNLCPKLQHLPPVGSSTGLASQRGGGRVYMVEEGDTLFDIARFELGKATRWVEIYELNKHVIGEDFNHLRPGMQLMLPTEPRRDDNFTRRPGATISR